MYALLQSPRATDCVGSHVGLLKGYEGLNSSFIITITLGGYRAGCLLKGGKGPWWSALGPPGELRKCQEMPTVL